MGKTALTMTREELRAYQLYKKKYAPPAEGRRQQAWEVAQVAADMLRREFGAERVVVFGSLAHAAWFTSRSDIDLMAWGIPPDKFYRAVAAVSRLSPDFKVDLLDPETAGADLRQRIEQEGIQL